MGHAKYGACPVATKPVILAVDDDPQVLSAVARDLRRKYGEQYRILRADSGASGLEAARELKLRHEPVALFLVDQRMPAMNGVAFLSEAMTLHPDAKRVLLTAYADTDAAIDAINTSRVHYYLLKPWDPPEETLYPVLDDLLTDWSDSYRPAFSGIRVVGDRWSPLSYTIKGFLARNHVPYRWLDVEREEEARFILAEMGRTQDELPLVLLPEGEVLSRPALLDIAQRAGLNTQPKASFYDLIIVGAGPAGLAAAVYGASEGLRVALIDSEAPGGQAGASSRIENYLGFPSGVSGGDLARRAVTQARKFGAEIIAPQEVAAVHLDGPYKNVSLTDGTALSAYAMVVATGVSYKTIGLPSLEALTGAGVYYGASTSEAVSCQDEDVHIVGAGNSAGQAAMNLSQYARSVTLVVRGTSLGAKMSQYLVSQIEATPNIHVRLCSEVTEVHGTGRLQAVTLDTNGQHETVPSSALFIFIGASPRTDWLEGLVLRDRHGFLLTGTDLSRGGKTAAGWPLERDPFLLETSVPGIFATGDVRSGSVKRVASAVREGSIAVQFIHQYLAQVGA
jgi:thioredoxin reductase (NADPH)